MINRAAAIRTNGHNLKGRNFTLKPVRNDIMASIMRKTTIMIIRRLEIFLSGFNKVNVPIRNPVKIRVIPSIIHSMVIIRLLSSLISPNPRTTDAVGIRWAIPQIIRNTEAV